MVSLKDVAKRCGVSTATVSKALNGHSDIGEKKCIQQCAVVDLQESIRKSRNTRYVQRIFSALLLWLDVLYCSGI